MYNKKESGFRATGILTSPLILSLKTDFTEDITIRGFSYNQGFKILKDSLDTAVFDELEIEIDFYEQSIESMVPLFEAYDDNQ